MPRKSRIDTPEGLHHVIGGGIGRRQILLNDAGCDHFLAHLGRISAEPQTACYGEGGADKSINKEN